MATRATRVERDSMGEMEVPEDAYFGASTARAILNFPISDLRPQRRFIRALGLIKEAAARVNRKLGLLDDRRADAIARAAREVANGALDDQFVVDVFQTGSGTSTNMNANEVIANRAAEMLGAPRGTRDVVHPNDDVNLGQSSNDVIPTALHVAASTAITDGLLPALGGLRETLEARADDFRDIVKTARTHLQDASPILLGQVFRGYAGQIERSERRARHATTELAEVALGGTAVGTGLNAHPEFAGLVCERLSAETGVDVRETDNHFQAQATLDAVVEASGSIRTVAVSLMKIADDLRSLGSGPRAGLGEIELPEVQPGSSIMPGKVNPVIAESVIQVCAHVCGNDLTIVQSGQWGRFELNTMLPVASYDLLQSIEILTAAIANLDARCVRGIEATDRGPRLVERGLAIVTGLVPWIGYDLSACIAQEAARSHRTIREVAETMTDLTSGQLDDALDPVRMTRPGYPRNFR